MTALENLQKSVRESDFYPWKNSTKLQKNVSRSLLIFTQGKEKLFLQSPT